MQQTAHRPKNATLERGMLLTIRAHPSYPCRSVCYSGAPRRSLRVRVRAEALPECVEAPAELARGRGCGLMEIENIIRYAPRAVGLKPSASQDEARLRGLRRIMYSKDHERQEVDGQC